VKHDTLEVGGTLEGKLGMKYMQKWQIFFMGGGGGGRHMMNTLSQLEEG
jgi:hypothetical protein